MKIGILQTGRVPGELLGKHGDYNEMFERFLAGRGLEFVTYVVLDHVFPIDVHDADGWLITGSKFGVYEEHEWIAPLEEFIRDVYAQSVPIVGICFGHQIIAQALGGKVEKFSGGWSVGIEDYKLDDFDDYVQLPAWHQDQIIELPADATVIGSSSSCQYAALVYSDKALSIQPHPEIAVDYLADLIEARKDILPADIAAQGKASLNRDTSSGQVADWISRFLQRDRNG